MVEQDQKVQNNRICIDCALLGIKKETRGPFSNYCEMHGSARDDAKRSKGLAKCKVSIMFKVIEEKRE